MRPNEMHRMARAGCHDDCAPDGWHDVPKVTGDYDLDATILHRHNKDLPDRLKLYLKRGSYNPKTGYNAYASGDE